VLLLDRYITLRHEQVQEVIYERIELIKPEHRDQLLHDLRERTGLPVHRVEIGSINFLRDIAVIRAYYFTKKPQANQPTT
jgi:hypothetical protein